MQILQLEEDEHCRQFGRDELHIAQVPFPKRYATGEHILQLKELLRKEQALHKPLIVEQGLHDELDPTPMLIDLSAQLLTQKLLTRLKPGRQPEH